MEREGLVVALFGTLSVRFTVFVPTVAVPFFVTQVIVQEPLVLLGIFDARLYGTVHDFDVPMPDPMLYVVPEKVQLMLWVKLEEARAILEQAGSDMSKVIKTSVFLTDMDDFAAMNSVYAQYFSEGALPARSAVQVAKLPKGAKVEIEAIAHK